MIAVVWPTDKAAINSQHAPPPDVSRTVRAPCLPDGCRKVATPTTPFAPKPVSTCLTSRTWTNRTRTNRTTDLGQATTDPIDTADQPSTLACTRMTMKKKAKRTMRMSLYHDPLKQDKLPHHTCQPTSVHSPSAETVPLPSPA